MSNINDFVIENGVLKEYTGSDKDVSIPNEVIEIDTWAFKKCEHLINVHIPSSVETIDPQAFYYCTNLSEIHLADGVKCIQANAFDGCNSLMHLNIPYLSVSKLRQRKQEYALWKGHTLHQERYHIWSVRRYLLA